MMQIKLPMTLLLAAVLAGCGGSSDSSDTLNIEDTANAPSSPSEAEEGIDEIMVSGSRALSCLAQDSDSDFSTKAALFDAGTYDAFGDFISDLPLTETSGAIAVASLSLTAERFVGVFFLGCNYELAAEDECDFFFDNRDVSVNNGVLSFTNFVNGGPTSTIVVDNPEYSSGRISVENPEAENEEISWTRDSDGTERYEQTDTSGSSLSFVEFPDCSGTATIDVFENSVRDSTTTMSWTSPLDGAFVLNAEHCEFETGVAVCESN